MKQETINKRLESLLRVQCTGCARCCKETLVPITSSDLIRIMKHTKQAASDIVQFVTNNEIHLEKDSKYWIKFGNKKRTMVLKKTKNQCQYLDDSNRCQIYSARPMTCRTFPITVHLDDENQIEDVALNRIIRDRYPKGSKRPLKDLMSAAKQEQSEDTLYHDLVDQWNRSHSTKSEQAFLLFITT